MTGRPSITLLTAKASLLHRLDGPCSFNDENQARASQVKSDTSTKPVGGLERRASVLRKICLYGYFTT